MADDFLELSVARLHRLVEAHRRDRSPAENRAEADALTPMRRVKFYAEKIGHVNGLFAAGRPLEEELDALCEAVPPAKRSIAIGMMTRILSNIVSAQLVAQQQSGTQAPLDGDEMHELGRLWKKYRGKLVGTEEHAHWGPYGWVRQHEVYPATMLGFAERWEDMLAEARFALSHEGIHFPAQHQTHAHIALAALDREPDEALRFDDPSINEWELWHLDQLVQRSSAEARERLRKRIPAEIYTAIVE